MMEVKALYNYGMNKSTRRLTELKAKLKEMLPVLRTQYRVKTLEVFGSFVRGDEEDNSDLDLLVIMPSDEPMHKRVLPIRKLLRDVHVPKDIIVYTPDEVEKWKNVTNAFITSIMKKGKVIYGL